jgi:SAM-dependent methyltransferase
VVGLDLSPEMVRLARERSRAEPNIEYRVADVTATALPDAAFDCIACVATLHHLPLGATLARFASALSRGGTLLVLDLYRASSFGDWATAAVAVPVSLAARAVRDGGLRESRDAREAWALHGAHDAYPTLADVRMACAACLPGARVRRHLYFRYSLVWRRPW